MSLNRIKDKDVSSMFLVAALALSTKRPDQLVAIFGSKHSPKSFSGKAQNGDDVHTWTSYFHDGLVTVTAPNGGKIMGTPADIEMFFAGTTANALATIQDGTGKALGAGAHNKKA
jgi:hypothetical protein